MHAALRYGGNYSISNLIKQRCWLVSTYQANQHLLDSGRSTHFEPGRHGKRLWKFIHLNGRSEQCLARRTFRRRVIFRRTPHLRTWRHGSESAGLSCMWCWCSDCKEQFTVAGLRGIGPSGSNICLSKKYLDSSVARLQRKANIVIHKEAQIRWQPLSATFCVPFALQCVHDAVASSSSVCSFELQRFSGFKTHLQWQPGSLSLASPLHPAPLTLGKCIPILCKL